jgi:hypothetical protein
MHAGDKPVAVLTRRYFLKLTGTTLGLAATLSPQRLLAADWQPGPDELKTLAAFAYDLFPHRRVPSSLYNDVAARLRQQAAASPESTAILREGLIQLHRLAGPPGWPALAGKERENAIRRLQGGPFFNMVRGTAVMVLYRDQRVWDLIGYGGNAIAKGGYLHRGFNDIDWLPEKS